VHTSAGVWSQSFVQAFKMQPYDHQVPGLENMCSIFMYNLNDYYLFRALMHMVKEIIIKKAQCYMLSCLVMGEDLHIVIRDRSRCNF
jgi:hypothetical protein